MVGPRAVSSSRRLPGAKGLGWLSSAAGVRLQRHLHSVFNAGVLLQGHLRVHTDSGHTLDLLPGHAIVESVNHVHDGESLGPDPAVIVVVYVGPAGVAITTPVAGAAPRTQSRPVPASP